MNEKYNEYHKEYYRTHRDKINARRRELAKDCVHVTRCKNCHWYIPDEHCCNLLYAVAKEDDYCSFANRKGKHDG